MSEIIQMCLTRLLSYFFQCYKLLLYGILLSLVFVLVGGTWREWRQENLNQALVEGVKETNIHKILILLDAGANPNIHDTTAKKLPFWSLFLDVWKKKSSVDIGSPILALAIKQRCGYNHFMPERYQIVKALLNKGADVNAVNVKGETPLLMLFEARMVPHSSITTTPEENIALVKLLLNAGANTESKDASGTTALMFAAQYGFRESTLLLLSKGANVNAVAKRSFPGTALSLAKVMGYQNIVKILLSHGAKNE